MMQTKRSQMRLRLGLARHEGMHVEAHPRRVAGERAQQRRIEMPGECERFLRFVKGCAHDGQQPLG